MNRFNASEVPLWLWACCYKPDRAQNRTPATIIDSTRGAGKRQFLVRFCVEVSLTAFEQGGWVGGVEEGGRGDDNNVASLGA